MDTINKDSCKISSDVFCSIAEIAINETNGINVVNSNNPTLPNILKKNGVSVSFENNKLTVTASVFVDYGKSIPEVTLEAQQNIISNIENITSRKVTSVNLFIEGINFN